jgi:hypothetical protein
LLLRLLAPMLIVAAELGGDSILLIDISSVSEWRKDSGCRLNSIESLMSRTKKRAMKLESNGISCLPLPSSVSKIEQQLSISNTTFNLSRDLEFVFKECRR